MLDCYILPNKTSFSRKPDVSMKRELSFQKRHTACLTQCSCKMLTAPIINDQSKDVANPPRNKLSQNGLHPVKDITYLVYPLDSTMLRHSD